MINIEELRRLVQAATPGEWYVVGGNCIYGRENVTDGEEEWCPVIACTDDDEVNVNFEANAAFIAAANPAAISELLDRLEAAESDAAHQKALADSALRVAEGWERKCATLRNEIAEMKQQEPVATIRVNSITGNPSVDLIPGHRYLHHNSSLYTLPGAKGEEK